MALDKNKLAPGDVVLIKWPAGWHSAIAIPTPANAQAGVYLAHCKGDQSGTIIETYETIVKDSAEEHGFRRTDIATDGALAATYAAGWSVIPTVQAAFGTAYGSFPKNSEVKNASRAMGVVRAIGTNPPFEFDALYRVFKWTGRADTHKVFSENRGTTCCAFVMASHQAARMHKFFEGFGRLDLIPKITLDLVAGRGKEKTLENPMKVDDKTFFPGQALRDNANRQSKSATLNADIAQNGIEGFWQKMGEKTGCYWDSTLASLMGAALFHDAKFVYSEDFYNYLKTDGAWTRV